ncbi:MAG: dUTP diphosphatase [Flavobacteriales bacterium]|nr:MAG: dUTP diphosphatase [Flavobacteriales bacterium]
MYSDEGKVTAVEVRTREGAILPKYQTAASAGMDLHAYLPNETIELAPGEYKLIPTGLYIALPEGTEAQVRPRSGLAFKNGVTVLNSPGTIDADYRGEVGVLLVNHGKSKFLIQHGDRIAQMVVAEYSRVQWRLSENLSSTQRGEGGFGSTGN